MLGQHDDVRAAFIPQQPEPVLQASNRFTAADVDVLELGWRDLEPAAALFEQFGKVHHLVAILLPNSHEVGRYTALTEQIIKRLLQIGLLAQRICPGGCQHLMRPHRREVPREPLKHEAVGALLRFFLNLPRA